MTWALDTLVAMNYWSAEDWTVVSYEELVLDSMTVLKRIYAGWGQQVPEAAKAKIGQKSREAREWSQFDPSGVKRLGVWQETLSREQIHSILDIVHAVGLVEFSEATEPDYVRLYSRHKVT